MTDNKQLKTQQLCNIIEETLGYKLNTPRDFSCLSKIIFSRQHVQISPTTLKRVWGYLKENTETRISTLNILSRFIGYKDWSEFCKNNNPIEVEMQEYFIQTKKYLPAISKSDRRLKLTGTPTDTVLFFIWETRHSK